MPVPKEVWLAARAEARKAPSEAKIDSCAIRRRPDGEVDVVITGHGLFPGAAPPSVVVGGRQARVIEIQDQSILRARVADARAGDEVVVELAPVGRLVGSAEESS